MTIYDTPLNNADTKKQLLDLDYICLPLLLSQKCKAGELKIDAHVSCSDYMSLRRRFCFEERIFLEIYVPILDGFKVCIVSSSSTN